MDAGAAMTVGAAAVSLSNYSGNNAAATRTGSPSAGTMTATGTPFASVYPNNGTVSGITALSGGRIIANQAPPPASPGTPST